MSRSLVVEQLGARLLRGTARAWSWAGALADALPLADRSYLSRQALQLLGPELGPPVLYLGPAGRELQAVRRQFPGVTTIAGGSPSANLGGLGEKPLPWEPGAFRAILAPHLIEASPSHTTLVELARLLRHEGRALLGAEERGSALVAGAARCPAYVEATLADLHDCGLWPTLHVGLRRGQWLIDCVRVCPGRQ